MLEQTDLDSINGAIDALAASVSKELAQIAAALANAAPGPDGSRTNSPDPEGVREVLARINHLKSQLDADDSFVEVESYDVKVGSQPDSDSVSNPDFDASQPESASNPRFVPGSFDSRFDSRSGLDSDERSSLEGSHFGSISNPDFDASQPESASNPRYIR